MNTWNTGLHIHIGELDVNLFISLATVVCKSLPIPDFHPFKERVKAAAAVFNSSDSDSDALSLLLVHELPYTDIFIALFYHLFLANKSTNCI